MSSITLVENFETGDIVEALKALSVGARFLQSWVIEDHFETSTFHTNSIRLIKYRTIRKKVRLTFSHFVQYFLNQESLYFRYCP